MPKFYEETKGIYRLKVPFERIYTSVYLLISNEKAILIDCATSENDVNEHIIPALKEIGYSLSDICMIVLTHDHSDHSGGLDRILSLSPNIEVIRSVRDIFDGVSTYPMPGHTNDCIGILDLRTNTLISGDGLQGAGVDKYRCYTENPVAYLETIKRIREDDRIENILFSHDYEPWNCNSTFGRKNVEKHLDDCLKYVSL